MRREAKHAERAASSVAAEEAASAEVENRTGIVSRHFASSTHSSASVESHGGVHAPPVRREVRKHEAVEAPRQLGRIGVRRRGWVGGIYWHILRTKFPQVAQFLGGGYMGTRQPSAGYSAHC